MKRTLFLLLFAAITLLSTAQTWIWYPGDYEIWLGNQMNNRRTERGAFFPPFWKMDSHYVLVEFSKKIDLAVPEEIEIAVEGKFNIKLDGKLQFGMPKKILLPVGKHSLNIKVWNQATPPAIFINGKTIKSDSSWKVTYEDKEWIDASGKASDTSATIYIDAEGWTDFNTADKLPSAYKLSTEVQQPVKVETVENGQLIDFGKETFGYLRFHLLKGNGKINIYYGESREEALDKKFCETLDQLAVNGNSVTDEALADTKPLTEEYTLANSKAFRYAYITKDSGVDYKEVNMLYEYKPETRRGSFKCNDDEVNQMWNVGAYTMQLTTREFFIDGIKRDRWTWSGDAIQSYLMNFYLFFDNQTVKNTIWELRGKDPVTSHTNTIMDYSFYWFLSIYDYYMYTGDRHFIEQVYPRMQTLMDYVLGRTDKNGMVEGLTGDWVFVDWADGYMDKHGELSYEQVLFCKSLETMALCAKLANNDADKAKYDELATSLRSKLVPDFWSDTKQALVHNRIDGKQQPQVTRYSNMFAVFFNYLSPEKQQIIKKSVLMNDSVMKISTPYMRFYELEALCAMGEQKQVMKEMKDYWGGMIREGASTFWEKYNPTDKGAQHLAMYGRPYGKSLCHAWGASPIYLLGKYYLGIQPVKAGYSEFVIAPNLGGLKWMEGTVPTPNGEIFLSCTPKLIVVKSDTGTGVLKFNSTVIPVCKTTTIKSKGNNKYEMLLEKGVEYFVKYKGID